MTDLRLVTSDPIKDLRGLTPQKAEDMDPISDPSSPETKPGYRSTEFWMSVAAMIVGVLLASGLFSPDDPTQGKILQALGVLASILASLGYTAGRAHTKATSIKGAAFVAAAAASVPSQPPAEK